MLKRLVLNLLGLLFLPFMFTFWLADRYCYWKFCWTKKSPNDEKFLNPIEDWLLYMMAIPAITIMGMQGFWGRRKARAEKLSGKFADNANQK